MADPMETDEAALGIKTPTPRADPEDMRARGEASHSHAGHSSMGEDPPGDPPAGGSAAMDDDVGPGHASHGGSAGHTGGPSHHTGSAARHYRLPSSFRDWEIDTTRFELIKLVGKGEWLWLLH